jgi:glycosyltransferase involved in cell wall biosynthesis
MNVLLIHPYYLPPGAAGSVRWNQMTRHMASQGHRLTVLAGTVDYLTGEPYAPILTEESEPGVRVVRVPMSQSYNQGRWGRLWAYNTFFWRSLWAVLFRVGEEIDVVVSTSPPLTVGLTGWLLAKWHRKPFVLEIRDLWPDAPVQMGYLKNPILRWAAYCLELFLYRKAAHLVTLTPAFSDVLITQKGVPESQIATIPNGADLTLTQATLANFDRATFRQKNKLEGRFWIIYAGAHGTANGLMSVLDAAETLQDVPAGFLLLGDGPEKPKLMQEAQRRGLTNVRFLPALPKSEALRWIAAADAGLVIMQPLPVFQTMLSAKLFDYLACGKPVFTAIDGITRQLVEQHEFGQFLDPNQPSVWCKQICLYIDTPTLVTDYGNNGQKYAFEVADRASLAHRYETLLTRVHRSHQADP